MGRRRWACPGSRQRYLPVAWNLTSVERSFAFKRILPSVSLLSYREQISPWMKFHVPNNENWLYTQLLYSMCLCMITFMRTVSPVTIYMQKKYFQVNWEPKAAINSLGFKIKRKQKFTNTPISTLNKKLITQSLLKRQELQIIHLFSFDLSNCIQNM